MGDLHETFSGCSRHTRIPDPLKAEYQMDPSESSYFLATMEKHPFFFLFVLLGLVNCKEPGKLSVKQSKFFKHSIRQGN